MTGLSLLRVNVIIAIIAAAITAGLMAGLSLVDSIDLLVSGMGGGADTALSYILLGTFAIAISYTGITTILVNYLIRVLTGKKTMMLLAIAGVASLSQNVIPVHIAFIPILIPPLLKLFDSMRLDRRAVATALTFGLKAPYIMIPAGFGLMFHRIINTAMEDNGAALSMKEVALSMLIPGSGMIVGLLVAVFITYRKDRDAIPGAGGADGILIEDNDDQVSFTMTHVWTIVAVIGALGVQLYTENLIAGALTGIVLMFVFIVVPFKNADKVINDGIKMMGMIAFVMLVASGYGTILTETGAVDALINASSSFLNNNGKAVIAFILLLVGLV